MPHHGGTRRVAGAGGAPGEARGFRVLVVKPWSHVVSTDKQTVSQTTDTRGLMAARALPQRKPLTNGLSAAPLVRIANRRPARLSGLRISVGPPCPTLVCEPSGGGPQRPVGRRRCPSPDSYWPAMPRSETVGLGRLAVFARAAAENVDSLNRTCVRRLAWGGAAANGAALRNTGTLPRRQAAMRESAKYVPKPVGRGLAGVALRATHGCLPAASGRSRRRERDCEGGRGHGCCKRPI
jgi:hypothetical protein